jgi:hypothetical protein
VVRPRGGRAGTPGRVYSNRSDLNTQRGPIPITPARGQVYGAAQAQQQAQTVLPMAPPGAPSSPAGAIPPSAPVTAGGGAPPPGPGGLGALNRPTERPTEHVMTGVPTGPGAGPEAMPGFVGNNQQSVQGLLDNLARQPFATPEVQRLAAYVKAGNG